MVRSQPGVRERPDPTFIQRLHHENLDRRRFGREGFRPADKPSVAQQPVEKVILILFGRGPRTEDVGTQKPLYRLHVDFVIPIAVTAR